MDKTPADVIADAVMLYLHQPLRFKEAGHAIVAALVGAGFAIVPRRRGSGRLVVERKPGPKPLVENAKRRAIVIEKT